MRKKINVKPVDEIELAFEDNKSILLIFNAEALMHFDDLEGGITSLIKGCNIPEMCAKIIYIGAVSHTVDFTIEEARKITANLDPSTIMEIVNEFNTNMGIEKNEVNSELQKKLMTEFLMNMK